MHRFKCAALAAGIVAIVMTASVAQARPRGWYGPGGYGPGAYGPGWGGGWDNPWGDPGWGGAYDSPGLPVRTYDPREGKIQVSRFVASPEAASELGHGDVTITSESGAEDWIAQGDRATFEAAVVDSLVGAGYDTRDRHADSGQVAELRISRQQLAPAEEKRSPVSGSAAMSVGTYGSAYGLAINVDLSKPRSALVSTRLDVRIADKASGKILWEGYATIATRDGDDGWTDTKIANRLSEALFDNFPKADPLGKL